MERIKNSQSRVGIQSVSRRRLSSRSVSRRKLGKRRIRGQGLTEYIIVVALIGIGAVAAVSNFGEAVQTQFANMGSGLNGKAEMTDFTAHTAAAKGLGNYKEDVAGGTQ